MIKCYDTASSSFQGGVPNDAAAILFYTDGHFANESAARARFPHLFATKHAIGLTVLGRVPTEGDDFEPGNWQGNVGQWCRESIGKGVHRPIVYADGSDFANKVWPELEAAFGRPLAPPGPGRRFRTILANPDGDPTIPADHDSKQYWWGSIQGKGRVDYDISALRDDFFPAPAIVPPPPEPPKGVTVVTGPNPYMTKDGRVGLAVGTDKNEVFHIEQQNAPGTVDPSTGQPASTDWWRKAGGEPDWLSLGVVA